MATPLNPSDLYAMKGNYDEILMTFEYPMAHGNECAGIVVKNGGGWTGSRVMGKRVACGRKSKDGHYAHGGCYEQYVIANAMSVIALPDDISYEKGCMHIVNPLTAIGLVERINIHKSEAAIQTGAASQCGRMVIKLCQEQKIPLINVVRREE